ncbi:MAG: D-alanine--D-alanine ligase [Lachnospiraceae bacterium]|nr:D-alanine--D-alanine ligase [Lachnospiraceae bacterium]
MKIVVLAGGTSTERDVSLVTGKKVYQALKNKGHQVVLLDIYLGYTGDDYAEVFALEKDWAEEIGAIGTQAPDLEKIKELRIKTDGGRSFFGPHVLDICSLSDIVFLGLHGSNGEDGRVQAVFDLFGIRYTGSGYMGAALSMDKGLSKTLFDAYRICTPKGITMSRQEYLAGEKHYGEVPYPCVVKTCCGGSSVGVYIVNDDEQYEQALCDAFSLEAEIIVEQYIKGREFSVGVMEGKALPVIEIAPLQGFYDYKNKYQAGSTVETCPAELTEEETDRMQRAAEAAFEALRLEAYARMDFIMQEDGTCYCLEANTLPGMTDTSLLPQEAQAIGIGYEELCQKIVDISLKKYRRI